MKDKDPNQIAAIEKAIGEKYGTDAIQNPNANWNEDREKVYLQQMKEFYDKVKRNEEQQEKIDINGIKVTKKLLNRESLKCCPVCGTFPKKSRDDVCLIKFKCCSLCYDTYVFGREERWIEGWRPDEVKQRNT
jgi:hypothetical protein|tara:strand:+ start:514 stop:912 length:399 start_codon:yes stop_codon:yes gene_type:complete